MLRDPTGGCVTTIAYAAARWADLCTERDIRTLRSLQRRVLLSITGAYRTASFDSLCVIAGKAPVDILLQKSRAFYQIRKGMDARIGEVVIPVGQLNRKDRIRNEAANAWQDDWIHSSVGRVTTAFFKSIQERLSKPWIYINHWVSQALTGHGDFRARLALLDLADSAECVCGDGQDTVQHYLLHCSRFEAQRIALRDLASSGGWEWPEVAQFFVFTPQMYSIFADFCRESLWLKRQ